MKPIRPLLSVAIAASAMAGAVAPASASLPIGFTARSNAPAFDLSASYAQAKQRDDQGEQFQPADKDVSDGNAEMLFLFIEPQVVEEISPHLAGRQANP